MTNLSHTSNGDLTSQRPYSLENILGAAMSRPQALALIRSDTEAYNIFQTFPDIEQHRLLSFIQGNQGLRIMYESFAQKILKPSTHPERLESFLSAILEEPVQIMEVLPREGSRLSDKGTLVIMDFLVRLSDGAITNVEIQQVGYAFPGERADCYISDLILRQYNLLRSEQGSAFSYRHMKPVYLIIIMEQSSSSFLAAAPHYIHREQSSYDSGAEVVSLYHTIYISLDTFHKFVQNIDTKLHAWLTFLGSDQPADIVKLVNAYPEFLPLYRDIMEFRRHPKELMTMFSEALAIMDHNTELYMIDEMKKEIDELQKTIDEHLNTINDMNNVIAEKQHTIAEKQHTITEKQHTITEAQHTIAEAQHTIAEA